MANHGLFIGVNYTGSSNALRGCINDARNWLAFFGPFCATVKELLEQSATKAGMVAAISEVLGKLKADDTAIITYSGHGTYIPDRSGDEDDRRDEALCPFDLNMNLLLDDELRDLLAQRAAGSRVLIITDCCHSGTATRDMHETEHGDVKFARYVPFAELTSCMCPNDVDRIARKAREYRKRRRNARAAEPAMNLVHLAGCLDTEVSYDATIGGLPCGAFTYYALAALKARQTKGLTFGEWRDAVTPLRLPSSRYPQTPVFNGPMTVVVPGFEVVSTPVVPVQSTEVLEGTLKDGRPFRMQIG